MNDLHPLGAMPSAAADFAGQHVLVTGAASGIGQALALALLAHGARAVSYTHLTLPTKRIV